MDVNDERFNCPKDADHEGPVVSIEKNLVHKDTFLSASLQGSVIVWKFVKGSEDNLVTKSWEVLQTNITCAKWFDETKIILAQKSG